MLVFMNIYLQFVAKEGDTVEPGVKVAVISKSGEGVSHVAPSEKISDKAAPVKKAEEKKPKAEAAPAAEKPKAPAPPPPPPPKRSASEPQLPPKERERRVSLGHSY